MGDRLVLDAARAPAGMVCGGCRQKRHKFAPWPPNWSDGDGCPCCWQHDDSQHSDENER